MTMPINGKNVVFPKFSSDDRQILLWNHNSSIVKDLNTENCEFWDKLRLNHEDYACDIVVIEGNKFTQRFNESDVHFSGGTFIWLLGGNYSFSSIENVPISKKQILWYCCFYYTLWYFIIMAVLLFQTEKYY